MRSCIFCKGFQKCDLIFSGLEEADICADILKRNNLIIEGTRYYDMEFLDFIEKHNYHIETIRFYYSYETVIIESALVNSQEGGYCEDCIIKISASGMTYRWR